MRVQIPLPALSLPTHSDFSRSDVLHCGLSHLAWIFGRAAGVFPGDGPRPWTRRLRLCATGLYGGLSGLAGIRQTAFPELRSRLPYFTPLALRILTGSKPRRKTSPHAWQGPGPRQTRIFNPPKESHNVIPLNRTHSRLRSKSLTRLFHPLQWACLVRAGFCVYA